MSSAPAHQTMNRTANQLLQKQKTKNRNTQEVCVKNVQMLPVFITSNTKPLCIRVLVGSEMNYVPDSDVYNHKGAQLRKKSPPTCRQLFSPVQEKVVENT